MRLGCVRCGSAYPPDFKMFKCPRCGGLLDVVYDELEWSPRGRGVWRYEGMLPLKRREAVTIMEGGTPLVESTKYPNAYIKFEGANPTGSFKDRGMTVGVSVALKAGARAVIVASTGNTASSMSAYASRGRMAPIIVVPKGKIARGKLFQSFLHGAHVIEIDGYFDEALRLVMEHGVEAAYPLNSFNPWRLEGQKTIAFEIYEEVGCPDNVVVPVGNGGNIAAIWKGFKELAQLGLCRGTPRMIGVQAEGAAPLARAWELGVEEPLWVDDPNTVATAIRIGRPVNWPKTLRAVRESGGAFVTVSDGEILKAQAEMAQREGIGAEPAGAAAYAALRKVRLGGTTVAVVTGHALKDPDIVDIRTHYVDSADKFLRLLSTIIPGT